MWQTGTSADEVFNLKFKKSDKRGTKADFFQSHEIFQVRNYLPRHSSIWNSLTRHSSNRNSLTRHSPTWYSLPWHLSISDNFLPKYSDFSKFPSYTLGLAHKMSRRANRPDGHKTPVRPIVSKDIKRPVGPIVPKDIKRPVRPTILKDIKLLQAILFG